MKTVVVGALALLIGVFVGGIGPRAELRQTKKELAEARTRAAGSSALPLALGMGGLMAARERAQSVPRFNTPADAGAGAGAAAQAQTEPIRRERRSMFGDGGAGADGFAAAQVATEMRAAQFRAAFVEEARLSPEREQTLTRTIDQMNQEFAQVASEAAEALRNKSGKVRPRELADVGARLLDVYRKADDGLQAGLDEAGRAAQQRTGFDVLTQIDLGVFRRLAETMEQVDVGQALR